MARSHAFVPPKGLPELKEPQLRTLIRRRAELKAELAKLEAKLEVAENDLRAYVGFGYCQVTTMHGKWYEVCCSQVEVELLDRPSVERLLTPKALKSCLKKSHRNVLTVRPVKPEYVRAEYKEV